MILVLILSIYVCLLAFAYGWAVLEILARVGGFSLRPAPRFPLVVLVGLAALTTAADALSLVVKIGLLAHGSIVLAAIVYGLFRLKSLREPIAAYGTALRSSAQAARFGFGVGCLVTLVHTAAPPMNLDTGIYHAQVIHWIEQFGVVPGLANLDVRFAFADAWSVTNAFFSFSFLGEGHRSFHVVNGTLFLLFLALACEGLGRPSDARLAAANTVKLALVPLGLGLFGPWLSSPTPDIAVTLIIWTVLTLFFEKASLDRLSTLDGEVVAMGLLSFAAAVIKLSALPLLLVPTYLCWRTSRRLVLVFGLSAFAIFTPFCARNVVTSGYLVYPFPQLDILDVDWKVPPARVAYAQKEIRAWAMRQQPATQRTSQSYDAYLDTPLRKWIPDWWQQKMSPLAKVAMLVLVGATPFYLTFLAASLWARGLNLAPRDLIAVVGTGYAGVLYWFVMAPDSRFAWGFLISLPLFLLALPAARLLVRLTTPAILTWVLVLGCGSSLYPAAVSEFPSLAAFRHRIWMPSDYPKSETVPSSFDQFAAATRSGRKSHQCWYEPFPCLPYPWLVNPERRGPTLASGFRSKEGGSLAAKFPLPQR